MLTVVFTGLIFIPYIARFSPNHPHLLWEAFLQGNVAQPYVYRILLPVLAYIGTQLVPVHPLVFHGIAMYAAFVGFVVALRQIALLFWKPSRLLNYFLLLSIPLIIPLTLNHQYIYDLPTLCLFTFGVLCLFQKRWIWYITIFTIATLNKETSLFLIIMFVSCYISSHASRTFWQVLLAQLLIYGTVRLLLVYAFHGTPGGMVEWHFLNHIHSYFTQPIRTFTHLIAVGVIIFCITKNIHDKPLILRRVVMVTAPIITILYLLFGYPYELRVYFEIYAPVFLLCFPHQLSEYQNTPPSLQLEG
jgi:hypothetical protein